MWKKCHSKEWIRICILIAKAPISNQLKVRTLKDAPFWRDLFSQQKSLSLYGTFSRHKVKRYVPLCVNGPLCQRHAGGNKELLVPNLHRVCTRNLFVDALAVYLTNLLMSCSMLLANSQFNFCKSIVMQRCHQKISNCRECCL